MSADLGPILKAAYPQVVATLTRVLGDMDRATDATQDALVKALQVWQVAGIPSNPVAWLITVGRNKALDVLRRDAKSINIDALADAGGVSLNPGRGPNGLKMELGGTDQTLHLVSANDVLERDIENLAFEDDLLRLMFTCCHPHLSADAQITLVLKVVLGLSLEEIARSLLVAPAAVEKRLTRAKQKLKEDEIAYEVPAQAEIGPRVQLVLQAIYLLFNEGYSRITDGELVRDSLIDEAIRLARIMCRLLRHNPEPRSLLALMLLSTARLPGRLSEGGELVPLHLQDRKRWDQALIQEGIALIDAVYSQRHPPSAYQIQAAISAIHSCAKTATATDWAQIVALFDKLQEYDPSPVVKVNLAVALCFASRSDDGLALLQGLSSVKQLTNYQPYYAALAFAYEKKHMLDEARQHYGHAIALATSPAQRRYLQRQQAQLGIE